MHPGCGGREKGASDRAVGSVLLAPLGEASACLSRGHPGPAAMGTGRPNGTNRAAQRARSSRRRCTRSGRQPARDPIRGVAIVPTPIAVDESSVGRWDRPAQRRLDDTGARRQQLTLRARCETVTPVGAYARRRRKASLWSAADSGQEEKPAPDARERPRVLLLVADLRLSPIRSCAVATVA